MTREVGLVILRFFHDLGAGLILNPFKSFRLLEGFYMKEVFMDHVQFLAVSMILFLLGIWGIFLNRKNILIMLMSIELMLLAVNLNFLFFSVYLDDFLGQLFALFVLTVAAAESAIGLALLVVYYRVRGSISVEFIHLMKG
jgi:NADH-quinone oxidoreductase subunit K